MDKVIKNKKGIETSDQSFLCYKTISQNSFVS